jgi:bleomycin hydrolase
MKKTFTAFVFLCLIFTTARAGDTVRISPNSNYLFTIVHRHEALPVQNQNRSLTCWSFSTLSFFESELIRMGKGQHKLSEMYVVRNTYIGKADMYVRKNGNSAFAGGGAFSDIPYVIRRWGIVPYSAYMGLNYGLEMHNHTEMDAVLKGIVDAVKDNPQKSLTPSWKTAFESALDAYLGKVPETFEYNGKKLTPQSYAKELGLDMDNYVSLTSYTHHPFYVQFPIEVMDNWSMGQSYNLPIDELMSVMDHALSKGFTFAWGGDVSEKGFSHPEGLAIVPAHDSMIKVKGKENRVFDSPEKVDKSGNAFISPMPEKKITQEDRQKSFDAQETTDDHGMHVIGLATDQNGKKYYIIKNSWGDKTNSCGGYIYSSENYVRYKTINIFLHKEAIPKNILKKLNIQS